MLSILVAIQSYMRKYHVSQRELAERTGIAQPHLSDYFRGKRAPSAEKIDRMFAGLEVEVKLVPRPLPMSE